jgi:RND family efflux transporter MFP subunit
MKKRILIIVVALVIIAGLIVVRRIRVHQKENAPLAPEPTIAVRVAAVAQERVVRSRHVLGAVLGADEADLAPRVMAQVVAVNVREGDLVQAGQVLATLDDREAQDALGEARTAQTAAEAAYLAQHDATVRDRRLFEVKAIAQEQWDRSVATDAAAAAQREAAARRLDSAQTRLSYCQLAAPAAGVVARRLADPGDLAVPGKPLFKFVRQETVRVRADLPPEDWTALRIGLPVTLTLGTTKVEATVSRVFPAMGANQLASFEADVPQPPAGFVSGAAVGVDVQLGTAEGLAVPSAALLESDRGAFVFAVANDMVRAVKVEVLDRSLEKVVVKGDLRAGEPVVVAQPSRLMTLTGGMKITVDAGR